MIVSSHFSIVNNSSTDYCNCEGALGPFRNRKTREKIIRNRKTEKTFRSKPKTA